MNKFSYITLALVLVSACLSHAAPNVGEYEDDRKVDDDDESDVNNLLFPYIISKIERRDSVEARKHNNMIPSGSGVDFVDLERESSSTYELPTISDSVAPQQNPAGSTSEMDQIRSIAFNNREVKLVGKERKEVEVKGDVGTQMLIALENLQKEASDVWGQVNVKLDKGWTEFKTMVEGAVNKNGNMKRANAATSSPSSSRQLRETSPKDISSLVVVSDVDGYSMADDDLSKQAESAGSKIKGFLSNIGINEENGKKANEALSKAGASVSETMTKDLPDALKKAGSSVSDTVTKDLPDALKKAGTAVSDTVTKDLPEAFKNFFG